MIFASPDFEGEREESLRHVWSVEEEGMRERVLFRERERRG